MKKIIAVFVTLCMTLTLCACSSPKLADIYEEEKVIARGKEVVDLIHAFDFTSVNEEVREDLQDNLSVDVLENALREPMESAGAFIDYSIITAMGQKSKSTGEDYATAIIGCKYENASIIYTITMDHNMDIVGIYRK